MPRTTKPLSSTEVKQAKPKDKIYNLADGQGLYLKVKPSGYKVWIFNYYKPFTKKRVADTLGEYPAISLADARVLRQAHQKLLAQNIDPITHKQENARNNSDAHSNTLKHITKDWLQIKKSKISQSHGEDIYRSLELHIFPKLGDTPVHLIRARAVIEVIKPIAAKGSLETVKRLCQRLNEIMVYATNTGLIHSNPLSGISQAFESPSKTHMPTLKPDELPQLMTTIARASIKLTTRCLIEWQLQTMTRPSEAAGTRWEEIDLNKNLWHIPAERMKKKKDHTVPLTPQTIALLEIMNPISAHREHVFPADRNPRTHSNPQTTNMALKRMGYGGKLVAHGLRALASTTLNEQGFDPDIIEAALAHIDKNDVRSAYNRAEYLERRAVMMVWWSNHIEEAGAGNFSLGSSKHLRAIS